MSNIFRKRLPLGPGMFAPRGNPPVAGPQGVTTTQIQPKFLRARAGDNRLYLGDVDSRVTVCIQRKLGGLGDVLMTTPCLRAIKEQYPNCHLTYATDPTLFRVLEGNPHIDQIVDFRLINPGAFDFFADVTSVCPPHEKPGKPNINRIDLFARRIGVELKDPLPVYVPGVDEVKWAKQWLEQQWGPRKSYKLVVLSVASVDKRRSWPTELSQELIQLVQASRSDVRFIVDDFNNTGGPWDLVNTSARRWGLRQMVALINDCDLFVGPDSGLLHFAGALSKPIVGIFGPTPPAARLNHYPNALAVTQELGCQYCWYSRCSYDLACLKQLSVHQVLEAVLSKLAFNLPASAFQDNRFRVRAINPDPRSQVVVGALKNALDFLGHEAAVGGPLATDINVDVICLNSLVSYSSPPTGALSCAYVLGEPGAMNKTMAIKLAKFYDFIMVANSSMAEAVYESGVRKMIQIAPLPVLAMAKPLGGTVTQVTDISDWTDDPTASLSSLTTSSSIVVDMNPSSLGVLATQAAANGARLVLHKDLKLTLPDQFVTRCDPEDLEETLEWVMANPVETQALAAGAAEWIRDNLRLKGTSLLLNLAYQGITMR